MKIVIPGGGEWWSPRSALVFQSAPIPLWLGWVLTLMGAGVVVSEIRDLYAALGLPGGSWPWAESPSVTRHGSSEGTP